MSAPDEYLCPITYEVMTDPVILSDGHTYERSAIEQWLQTRHTSPLSNQRVSLAELKPNFALRTAIERWRATQTAGLTAAAAAAPASTPPLTFHARAGADGIVLGCTSNTPLETAVIAVIDRSGSMGGSAAPQSAAAEANLFSRLDLVKHSMRTVAAMLAENGASLGIISFSDTATIDMPVKKMTAATTETETAISRMYAAGGTNLWDGLRKALDQATQYARANPAANIHIMLLTDGEPTPDYNPLQGIVGALKKKLASLPTKVTLSSFGFGYSLDVKLLESICTEGGGIYGYLPDCSMVGTVFINYCAAALSTAAAHVAVGDKYVGAVQIGKERLIPLEGGAGAAPLTIRYGAGARTTVTPTAATDDEMADVKVIRQVLKALQGCMLSGPLSQQNVQAVKDLVDWIGDHDDAFRTAILTDISSADENKGQLLKALSSEDWFRRWGLNHLLSYSRALACGQCVNFKDAAPQFFAGPLFQKIQEGGNELFDNLPAPTPSLAGYGGYGGGWGMGAAATTAAPMTMAAFNNMAGGCFAGHCQVEMADGTRKYVTQLRAGDIVRGGFRIACVVRTSLTRQPQMVSLPGLLITPWHPVRQENRWVFPEDLGSAAPANITAYYNLVLESGHFVRIGNYDVCTLGHGFTENSVIRHPYFGTPRVVEDLQRHPGWSAGLIELTPASVERCPQTGLIRAIA